jgi:toxin ParE1/3/4
MKVTFEPAAREELENIYQWIARDNPRAASDMLSRIEAKVMLLTSRSLAHIGRKGLVPGTRELIEWPYLIVYRVDEAIDEIVILAVFHGSQRREDFSGSE